MFLILLVVIVVLFLIQLELKRVIISRKYRHIKGSKEFPIVGNIASVKYHQLSDFNLILNELCPEPISKVTAFGRVMFVVSEPNVAQSILSSPVFYKRSYIFKFFEMENALFTTEYETWKPLRKGVNGAFSKKSIITMTPAFNKHIDGLCKSIEMGFVNKGTTFDIYQLIARFEINKVVETMLNVIDYNSSQHLVDTLQESTDNVGRRIFNPIYYPDIIYRFSTVCKKIRKGHELGKQIIRDIFGDSFDEKRKHLQDINNNTPNKIFIDELLKVDKDGKLLSYDEVVDNFKTIVTSGFETQSLAMGWTIVMLAMFPEIDQKVYEEICEHYHEDAYLDYDIVKKLTYLDMVIKETMRLFPVAPVTMRDSLQDAYIEPFGDVPKGTPVLVAIYKIHRSPDIWGPNADQFNPENFEPSKIQERHLYSYIPFGGGGGRNCIGKIYFVRTLQIDTHECFYRNSLRES